MKKFTLHELNAFTAVAEEGSFQAAALRLHRSHPSVHAAVSKLERQMSLALFDRTAYRVSLTDAGKCLLDRARDLLQRAEQFERLSHHLSMGEESDLTVVIGDLCPISPSMQLLRRFQDSLGSTRLHLHFEALSGPWERLLDHEAELILHHVRASDPRIESLPLYSVELVPVVAPGFLDMPPHADITPEEMRSYTQCVIRDSAKRLPPQDYFLIDGAHQWTVADQLMKKALIMEGMGWGHLPLHLIDAELKSGSLLSIEGRHFKRSQIDIVAARLSRSEHGPVAQRLWQHLQTPGNTAAHKPG